MSLGVPELRAEERLRALRVRLLDLDQDSELPRSGEILRAVADPELDVEDYEARSERYRRRDGFY